MKKILCMILALCMMFGIVSLISCKGNNGENDADTTTPEGTTTESPPVIEEPAEITAAMLRENYKLIRKDGASASVTEAFSKLIQAIKEVYGFTIKASDDFFKEGNPALAKGQYEILVGTTNREESEEFMSELKWEDYGYSMVGDKLVIGGKSDEGTVKAVELFIENLKKADRSEVFYNDSEAYLFKAEYDVKSLKINGVDIADITVVINSSKGMENSIAGKLRSIVCELSGDYPEIVLASDLEGDEKTLFIIGECGLVPAELKAKWDAGDGSGYYMGAQDNIIWAMAKDVSGLASISSEFKKLFVGNGELNVIIEDGFRASTQLETISVMSFNIYTNTSDSVRVERVIEMINKYKPDILGVQEASVSWMNILKTRINSDYDYVGVGRNGGNSGEYSAIFYLKDKFKVLDSGTKWLSSTPNVAGSKYDSSSYPRIMTYAVLERKSDGLNFLHVNTHLEHTNEESRVAQIEVLMSEIKKLPDLPTFITGDFNCTTSSSVYKSLMSSGYSDVSRIASESQISPTFHNYGSSSKLIDFIFCSSDIYAESYEVCNEKINGDYASDHHPIYSVAGIIG